MTWFLYPPMVALDQGGNPVRSGDGDIYAEDDNTYTTVLPITDVYGLAMADVTINDLGLTEAFLCESPEVKWRDGDLVVALSSPKGLRLEAEESKLAAQAAQVAAEAAAAAAATAGLPPNGTPGYVIYADEDGLPVWLPAPGGGGSGSGIAGAPAIWPSAFTPDQHAHVVTDLRRVAVGSPSISQIVLDLLNATSQSAARGAIGAGTGSGTSNLQVGTNSGDAMSATKTFTGTDITISAISGMSGIGNVQQALEWLKTNGGSGGGSTVVSNYVKLDYNFTTSSWPARSSLGTLPAGTAVLWRGPSFPTIGGTGAVSGLDEFRLKTS